MPFKPSEALTSNCPAPNVPNSRTADPPVNPNANVVRVSSGAMWATATLEYAFESHVTVTLEPLRLTLIFARILRRCFL
jgi:hypothetical protein